MLPNGPGEADARAMLADLFDDIWSKRLCAALDIELPRLHEAGVAVAEAVEEGWAVWGWQLVDDLFEFHVPGEVR